MNEDKEIVKTNSFQIPFRIDESDLMTTFSAYLLILMYLKLDKLGLLIHISSMNSIYSYLKITRGDSELWQHNLGYDCRTKNNNTVYIITSLKTSTSWRKISL